MASVRTGPDYHLMFSEADGEQAERASLRQTEREAEPEKTSSEEIDPAHTLTSDLIQEVKADWSLLPVSE